MPLDFFFRIRTTELWVTPNISDARRVLEWGFSLKWSSTFLKFSSFRLVRAWLPLLGVIKLPVVINFLCQLLMVLAGGASFLNIFLNLLLTVTALLVCSNITAHLIFSSVVKAILVFFVYLPFSLDIGRSILDTFLKI